MICFNFFETTSSHAVTSAAATFQPTAPSGEWKGRFIVVSDVDIHIDREGTATVASSPLIPAKLPVEIMLMGTDTLSYIKHTGAVDGTIWITKV